MFDVSNPADQRSRATSFRHWPDTAQLPGYTLGKGVLAMYTEYDRNIMWAFTENGVYALSSTLLGAPVTGMAKQPWPAR